MGFYTNNLEFPALQCWEMGCGSDFNRRLLMGIKFNDGNGYNDCYAGSGGNRVTLAATSNNENGFHTISRISQTDMRYYINGTHTIWQFKLIVTT